MDGNCGSGFHSICLEHSSLGQQGVGINFLTFGGFFPAGADLNAALIWLEKEEQQEQEMKGVEPAGGIGSNENARPFCHNILS